MSRSADRRIRVALLRDTRRQGLDLGDRRRVPSPGQDFGLRTVKSHDDIEGPLRRRKPVGFALLAWTVVLEIKIERTVGVVSERHPAADGEPVEAVAHLEAVRV